MSGDFQKPIKKTTDSIDTTGLGNSSLGERHLHVGEVWSEYALLLLGGNNAMKFLDPRSLAAPSNHFNSQDIFHLLDEYKDKLMICVNGTARDNAVTEKIQIFNDQLARRLVSQGVGLVCGGAETGAMGAAIRAFRQARDNFKSLHRLDAEAKIATVTLHFEGEHATYEPHAALKQHGRASEPQFSWLNRTLALHSAGRQLVQLMEPGGLGTFFEALFQFTNRQLTDKGPVGPFDANRRPSQIVLVSSRNPDGRSFWEGTLEQIREM